MVLIKRKVYFSVIDNIWVADLADMQLIRNFNLWFLSLLCVIGIFSKHEWIIFLKDKKNGITINSALQKILDESNRKTKKWIDRGSEHYNRSVKTLLQDDNIEMYWKHNDAKAAVAERFIRT